MAQNNKKFVIVVRAVIEEGGRYLVVIQKNKTPNKYFMFPGGHLHYHESLHEGVVREVQEELDIEVFPLEICFIKQTRSPFDNNLEIFIKCNLDTKSFPKIKKNVSEQEIIYGYEWISKEDLFTKKNFTPKEFFHSQINFSLLDLNLKQYKKIFGNDKNIRT